MRLRTIEFYQSVRLWNNSERKTIDEGSSPGVENLELSLVDHLVILTCSNHPDAIIVPTANMRHGKMSCEPKLPEVTPVEKKAAKKK